MRDDEKYNSKEMKYRLISMGKDQKGEMLDVLYFAGYWEKINKSDIDSLEEELMSGKEFRLTEVPNKSNVLLASDYDEEENREIPYVSDNFQIGPDGAYEHGEDFSDWDVTLNDGLEDE